MGYISKESYTEIKNQLKSGFKIKTIAVGTIKGIQSDQKKSASTDNAKSTSCESTTSTSTTSE
jgi:hypothetical protein